MLTDSQFSYIEFMQRLIRNRQALPLLIMLVPLIYANSLAIVVWQFLDLTHPHADVTLKDNMATTVSHRTLWRTEYWRNIRRNV